MPNIVQADVADRMATIEALTRLVLAAANRGDEDWWETTVRRLNTIAVIVDETKQLMGAA
jgi:hypothetical protein